MIMNSCWSSYLGGSSYEIPISYHLYWHCILMLRTWMTAMFRQPCLVTIACIFFNISSFADQSSYVTMFGTALVAAIAVLIKYLNELTTLFGNSNKDEQTFKDLLMLATVLRDVKILSKQGMQLMGASSSSNTISRGVALH